MQLAVQKQEAYCVEVLCVLGTHCVITILVADHRPVRVVVHVGAEGTPALSGNVPSRAEPEEGKGQHEGGGFSRHEHDGLRGGEVGVDLGGVDVADKVVHPAGDGAVHVVHVDREPATPSPAPSVSKRRGEGHSGRGADQSRAEGMV